MKSYFFALAIFASMFAFGCGGAANTADTNTAGNETAAASPGSGTDTAPDSAASTAGAIASPTDAIKTIVEGVKAKDSDMIRSALSKATLTRFDKMAQEESKSFYEIFVAEDFEEMSKLPEMRNEKIDGDKAMLELQNDKTGEWDPLPFVKEDGSWKLAIFDGAPEGEM
ncbi:MAG: hypothetical protein IPM63_12655 [Acidobacteriota bacterium]|nr:MAG: hypothetical protein IPM63_12655 [Acidobacteriota bacterium]